MPRERGLASRRVVAIVVVVLLLLPVLLGALLGWYFVNPPMYEQLSPVGTAAHELLDSFPDSSLVVEIATPAGEAPPASAVSLLWSRMNETLDKSSIRFQLESYSPGPSAAYSDRQLFGLESQLRHQWPGPGVISLFYLFVDGTYDGSNSVIGLSYRATSIAVFPQVITTALGGGSPQVYAAVMIHEFGHELGLVGIVGSAPNEDPAHPGHSTDPNDVMYWQIDTTGILSGLVGGQGPPTQFDAADMSDLQTVKETPILVELLPWVVLAVLLGAVTYFLISVRRSRPSPLAPEPRAGATGPTSP